MEPRRLRLESGFLGIPGALHVVAACESAILPAATQLRNRLRTTVCSEERTPAINASLDITLGHECSYTFLIHPTSTLEMHTNGVLACCVHGAAQGSRTGVFTQPDHANRPPLMMPTSQRRPVRSSHKQSGQQDLVYRRHLTEFNFHIHNLLLSSLSPDGARSHTHEDHGTSSTWFV